MERILVVWEGLVTILCPQPSGNWSRLEFILFSLLLPFSRDRREGLGEGLSILARALPGCGFFRVACGELRVFLLRLHFCGGFDDATRDIRFSSPRIARIFVFARFAGRFLIFRVKRLPRTLGRFGAGA